MKKSNKKKACETSYANRLQEVTRGYDEFCNNSQPVMSQGYQSQEEWAEMANRLQSARNLINNKSSAFRGKIINTGDINMYGTHVNGEKRKSRELVREGLKRQSTVTAVSDALDGRYPLERNIRAVTFCHDDFMKIVELIARVADSQLREDIVMAIIEAKSNAHDLLER